MSELELSEAAEELLGELWTAREEKHGRRLPATEVAADDQSLQELINAGLVTDESGTLSLTEAGEVEAAGVVRRERLAERLLADLLNVGDSLASETACRFEHLLRRGIDNQICTLLGHPRSCPHGSPIPPGECCRVGAEQTSKVVSSLAELEAGQSGVIAYIRSQRPEHLQRLLAMGAIPGARIVLRQRFPSFVFELGQSQVALDAETARDIYVLLDREAARTLRRGLVRRLERLRGRERLDAG